MKHLSLCSLALLPLLALPCLGSADALTDQALAKPAQSDQPLTIYLGSIAVGGKQEVLEALQGIKVALDQPISNDPRLADVVVCRLADDVGTHAKQLLICATNRVLNQNRELLQTAMTTAIGTDAPKGGDGHGGSSSACVDASCITRSVDILNESLSNERRHYIKQQVNGAALHQLLQGIPYPQGAQPVPAAATTAAPAAATAHV